MVSLMKTCIFPGSYSPFFGFVLPRSTGNIILIIIDKTSFLFMAFIRIVLSDYFFFININACKINFKNLFPSCSLRGRSFFWCDQNSKRDLPGT